MVYQVVNCSKDIHTHLTKNLSIYVKDVKELDLDFFLTDLAVSSMGNLNQIFTSSLLEFISLEGDNQRILNIIQKLKPYIYFLCLVDENNNIGNLKESKEYYEKLEILKAVNKVKVVFIQNTKEAISEYFKRYKH